MKTFICRISFFIAVVGMLSACSSDEEEGNRNTPFPNVSKITLSETINGDHSQNDVKKEEVYTFWNNQLMTHSTIQEYYEQSVSYDINFSYSEREATLTDANGNKATYTLNDQGYAIECLYLQFEQTRKYRFSYSNDYLIEVDEEIDGIPYSTITLHYASGDLQSIDANNQTFLFEVNKDTNLYHLPCLLFADLHPLSMHIDAIYARLLGKQSSHLIARSTPKGNEKEWTQYTYTLDATNKPTQIKAATISTGLVYDSEGVASEVTRTDTRTISVQVE